MLSTTSEAEPPEPSELNYFQVHEDGIQWLLRIRCGQPYPDVRPEVLTEPITPPYYDTARQSVMCRLRVVDLRVGDINRGRCLAVFELDPDGRQVLSRRFVGPDARYGDYEHLPADTTRLVNDQAYRHWSDTILFDP